MSLVVASVVSGAWLSWGIPLITVICVMTILALGLAMGRDDPK